MADQILIELVLEDSALQSAIPTLQKLGQITDAEAKKMSGLGNQTAEAFSKAGASGGKVITSLSGIQKSATALANTFEKQVAGVATDAFKLLKKEMLNSVKSSAFDDLKSKISDVNKQLLETAARMESLRRKGAVDTEGYRKLEKDLIAGKHEAAQLATSLDKVKQSVQSAKPEVKEFASTTAQLDVAQESLRKQLSSVTELMTAMALSGQNNSEEYKELATQAGTLKKAIGDTGKEIKTLAQGSAELTFSAAVQGVQALAGGFQATMAVSALFGEENEALQKTLVKLNGVMALTQAIEQIRMATGKESSLVTRLNIVSTKTLAVANRLTASTYATLGIAVTGTSTAFKVLRGAIIATGVGALVVAIGFAVNKIIEWTESTKDQASAQEELNKKLEEYQKKLDDAFKDSAAEKARQASIKAIDREIKLLEAQGGQELKIMNLKRQRSALELQSSRVRAATEQEYTEIQKEEAEKQTDIALDLHLEEIKFANKSAEERQKIADENSKKAKDRAERDAKAEFDIKERWLKRDADQASKIVDDDSNPSAIRLIALDDYLKQSKALLVSGEAEELRNKNLTESEKANIEDKYYIARIDLLQDFTKKRTGIITAQWQELEKAIAASFAGSSSAFAKDLDANLAEIETLFKMGLLSLQEYEEKRQKISDAFDKKSLENDIARTEKMIANRKAANQDITELEQQLFAFKGRLRQSEIDEHAKAQSAMREATERRIDAEMKKMQLATESQTATIAILMNSVNETIQGTGAEAALTVIANTYAKLRSATDELAEAQKKADAGIITQAELLQVKEKANQAYVTSTIAGGQQIISGIFAAAAQKRQLELETRLAALQEERDAEINNKALSEQQKSALEERYRQKEAQIKKAAYLRERQARISQAIINGLLAVTNALATAPTIIAGIALAGVAAATTAIQIGKIKSEPIPQFKKGTHSAPKGMAWVGEEGPELVRLRGGERIYTYKESMNLAKAWEGGATPNTYEIISANIPTPVGSDVINNYRQDGGYAIDYDKLGSSLAKHLPKPAVLQNNVDGDGFTTYVLDRGNKTQIKNKRYRVN